MAYESIFQNPTQVVNPKRTGMAPAALRTQTQLPPTANTKGRDMLVPEKKQELGTLIQALEERGAAPEQITQAAQNYFNENAKAPDPVQEEQPGFFKSLVRGITNVPARLGVEAYNVGSALNKAIFQGDVAGASAELDKPRNLPVLGKVKPTLTNSSKVGIREGLDIAGQGAEAASFFMGGGTAKELIKNPVKQTIKELFKQGVKEGSIIGTTGGLGMGLQKEDASVGSVLKDTAAGGLTGGVLGGVLGVGAPTISKVLQKAKNQTVKDVDSLVGSIVQGKKADIAIAKKALSNIDIGGVKTYEDLGKVLDTKVKTLSSKLDEVLGTRTDTKQLSKLKISTKVGDQNVSHNYVEDALNQLNELYKKTNDPAALAEISQLNKKAIIEGLTIKEVNDLAKKHGIEFGRKAFGKMGEPLTSVSAQAFENTRSGLKDTAKELFNDPIYDATDELLSHLIHTRKLVKDMSENVNKLQQKIITKGWGEKVGNLVAKISNVLSLGTLKGAVNFFIPRGEGLKVLNALDLEKVLQKNLQQVQALVSSNLPEATVIQRLEQMLGNGLGSSPPKLLK